jgi:hypothetical protein
MTRLTGPTGSDGNRRDDPDLRQKYEYRAEASGTVRADSLRDAFAAALAGARDDVRDTLRISLAAADPAPSGLLPMAAQGEVVGTDPWQGPDQSLQEAEEGPFDGLLSERLERLLNGDASRPTDLITTLGRAVPPPAAMHAIPEADRAPDPFDAIRLGGEKIAREYLQRRGRP